MEACWWDRHWGMAVMRITVENGPCSSRQTLPKQNTLAGKLKNRLQNVHAYLNVKLAREHAHCFGAPTSPAQLDDLQSTNAMPRNGCAG